VAVVVVLTAGGVALRAHLDYAGDEARATLRSGVPGGYVWDGPSLIVGGDLRWCLAPGQSFPTPTGQWDDGVLHGGDLATGTLRFVTKNEAVFVSDLDGESDAVTLVRDVDSRFGC
jgi:hypothetical protein